MSYSWKASYLVARDGASLRFKTEANQVLKWVIVGFVALFFLLSNNGSFAEFKIFRLFVFSFSFLSMLVVGSRKLVLISSLDKLVSIESGFFFLKKNRHYSITDVQELKVHSNGKKDYLNLIFQDESFVEVAIANRSESDNWQHEIKKVVGI